MSKTNMGNFFEDFVVGTTLYHATPRTVRESDGTLYTALYGGRFAPQSSAAFASAIGYETQPLDDFLVFNVVFGKTVPDISLNAIANLGYAECRFLRPIYPGMTLSTTSVVIGVKENSNGKTGVVYVRSTGRDSTGDVVLEYVRWVMVRKRDAASPAPTVVVPELSDRVSPDDLGAGLPALNTENFDCKLSGSQHFWSDYDIGERIDHIDGMTIEEAEHQLATRLFQNTAKVHFNQHTEGEGRFGKRIVYGGHVISMARALSFNGLANAIHVAAINGGRHVAPCFAGDTVYAWSGVEERVELPHRSDVGALRIRTIATKNHNCKQFPGRRDDGSYDDCVVLDLDYWVLIPR